MVSWAFVFVLSYIFVNLIGSSNGLLPGDTKPLTDPMLIYRHSNISQNKFDSEYEK